MNRSRALLLLLVPAAAAAATPSLRYADGRLSARVERAELADVLAELSRQAHLEFRGLAAAPQPVSLALDDVPLADALRHLLAGESFLLTYDGTRPARVTVLGRAATYDLHPPAPVIRPLPPSVDDTPASPDAATTDVAITGRLERALGAPRAGFRDIMGAAVRSQDARVRRDALRLALRMMDADPARYAGPLGMIAGMDDARLAAWLTNVAGDDAERVVRRTARTARDDGLRERARALVRWYRSLRAAG